MNTTALFSDHAAFPDEEGGKKKIREDDLWKIESGGGLDG